MIDFIEGDIFDSDVEALVNTVNCVGVMGRGIALQFKNAYPANYTLYRTACKKNEVRLGRMLVFSTGQLACPKYIINFPTKRHWRNKSRIQDIANGLQDLVKVLREKKITSIAIPPLGSGLGGLDWKKEVRPLLEMVLGPIAEVRIVVYEPHYAPTLTKQHNRSPVPQMTAGRAVMVELLHRYLQGLLDPFVSLLEVHKLMYFMQVTGENLRLRFAKAPFGPYAENLKHVLQRVEGHFVVGYSDGVDSPSKQLTLVPGAFEQAQLFLAQHAETRARFNRVSDLVDGFESSFGLELLSTVHWLLEHEKPSTLVELVKMVHAWNDRKRQFSHAQIELAATILISKGWVQTHFA
jgi:O-acetyl-ADP-ribose deacetylase (regulator of RNase III)